VHVVDLTTMAADDPTNHNKFAGSDVVSRIGLRLASGQPLNDAKSSLGESVGIIAVNAADAMGKATAAVVTTPFNSDESVMDAPQPERRRVR
jgi:esterase/lipase superfamily enzyme